MVHCLPLARVLTGRGGDGHGTCNWSMSSSERKTACLTSDWQARGQGVYNKKMQQDWFPLGSLARSPNGWTHSTCLHLLIWIGGLQFKGGVVSHLPRSGRSKPKPIQRGTRFCPQSPDRQMEPIDLRTSNPEAPGLGLGDLACTCESFFHC